MAILFFFINKAYFINYRKKEKSLFLTKLFLVCVYLYSLVALNYFFFRLSLFDFGVILVIVEKQKIENLLFYFFFVSQRKIDHHPIQLY